MSTVFHGPQLTVRKEREVIVDRSRGHKNEVTCNAT